REVAEADILPRFQRLTAGDIEQKTGPNDLVTAADLDAEAALTRRLTDLLPGSKVVGEEAAAKDPTVLARLDDVAPVWIIDPVDGTWNFTRGNSDFTVIVALVEGGKTRIGWIHDPIGDATVIAEEGAGTWEDGKRLTVAMPTNLTAMTAALYVGARRTPEMHARVKALKHDLGPRSYLSCAGAEYLALARGSTHYAVFTRLLPWDHAAGHLIHGEAGGYARMMDDRPYRPLPIDGNLLLAPDEGVWRKLRDLLLDKISPEHFSPRD
ncbi:MAG: inositol monophosphatase, partial [Alphaproteobacteria bacterium]|nr:inositol monophosphatase [Alphaproteobacteria bacterium]